MNDNIKKDLRYLESLLPVVQEERRVIEFECESSESLNELLKILYRVLDHVPIIDDDCDEETEKRYFNVMNKIREMIDN